MLRSLGISPSLILRMLWMPGAAYLAADKLLGLPWVYGFGVVWLAMVLGARLFGLFHKIQIRVLVAWAIVGAGYQMWSAMSAGQPVTAQMDMQLAFAAGLGMATLILERYKIGQGEQWLDIAWNKITTGRATRRSASDSGGSGRLRTAKEVLADPNFTADDSKPRIMTGVAIDERDVDDGKAKIAGMPSGILGSLTTYAEGAGEDKVVRYNRLGAFLKEQKVFSWLCPPAPLLYYRPVGAILTVAGARGGKSTGLMAGNLLTWSSSCVVHDTKGELRNWTWEFRERVLGHKCVWLDTSSPCGRDPVTWSFDMFSWLGTGESLVSDAKTAAGFMVAGSPAKGGEGGNFFDDKARSIVGAEIAYRLRRHKMHGEPRPKPVDLAGTLMGTKDDVLERFKTIVNEVSRDAVDMTLPKQDRISANDIRMMLSEYVGEVDGEMWSKTHSTITKELDWLSDNRMARLVSGVGSHVFDLEEVFTGKLTCYVCLKPEDLEQKPQAARSIFGSFLAIMMREKERMKRNGSCLYLLDEMSRLGNLDLLHKTGLELGAGSGIILWGVIQSIKGLDGAVGDGTFAKWMDNALLVHAFAIGDNETARYFSEALGKETVTQSNFAYDGGGMQSRGGTDQVQTTSKDVMSLDEILRLEPHLMLEKVKGALPFLAGKASYWLIDAFDQNINRERKEPPVEATPDESQVYRASIADTVDLFTSPSRKPLLDTIEAAKVRLADVAAARPDLFTQPVRETEDA